MKLAINDGYDFLSNKLIAKPDPTHPKKYTTNMFAFSESSWEPRALFHLEKGISKLKTKDWEGIMTAAAEYSSVINLKVDKPKKNLALATEEEELELSWEDSDAEGAD